MTSKKLRDVKISEDFIKKDQLLEAFDNISNKLESLSDCPMSSLPEIIEVLQKVIEKFGGKCDNDFVFEVEITADDIANNKNIVFFSQDPMMATSINWGD